MSLLNNAIRSIQIGLHEYEFNDRLLSSVRNIYAGILLLFKYKLFLMSEKDSNAALVKQNVIPTIDSNGAIAWKGAGNKTVDITEIKSRFKSLGIAVEWPIFDRINKHRNEIEHYFSDLPNNEISELLADCFIIINKFLSEHLNIDSREALGDEAWKILLDAHEVYEHEIEKHSHSMNTLKFHHKILKKVFLDFNCISCFSHLIQPTNPNTGAEHSNFICAECQSKYTYDDICNMGILDLCISSSETTAKKTPQQICNCEVCQEGLFLIDYGVCTACGIIDKTKISTNPALVKVRTTPRN